jgi:hypothetical protein
MIATIIFRRQIGKTNMVWHITERYLWCCTFSIGWWARVRTAGTVRSLAGFVLSLPAAPAPVRLLAVRPPWHVTVVQRWPHLVAGPSKLRA